MFLFGVDDACLTSAAAHVYSSVSNRHELRQQMREAIMDEIGSRSWNEFIDSLRLSSVTSDSGIQLESGGDGVIKAVPVGGESCTWFGLSCDGPDFNNIIVYDVKYKSGANRADINKLDLGFEMDLSTSRVDGVAVSEIMAAGGMPHDHNPESCLSQLFNSLDNSSHELISRQVIGEPETMQFGDEQVELCLAESTVRACVTSNDDGETVCENVTVRHYIFCSL